MSKLSVMDECYRTSSVYLTNESVQCTNCLHFSSEKVRTNNIEDVDEELVNNLQFPVEHISSKKNLSPTNMYARLVNPSVTNTDKHTGVLQFNNELKNDNKKGKESLANETSSAVCANQDKKQNANQKLGLNSNQKINQKLKQNSGQNSSQNSNQKLATNSNQKSNQKSHQNSNKKPNPNTNANSNQNANSNSTPNSNPNSNPNSSPKLNQNQSQNENENQNQNQNSNPKQNPNQKQNQNPKQRQSQKQKEISNHNAWFLKNKNGNGNNSVTKWNGEGVKKCVEESHSKSENRNGNDNGNGNGNGNEGGQSAGNGDNNNSNNNNGNGNSGKDNRKDDKKEEDNNGRDEYFGDNNNNDEDEDESDEDEKNGKNSKKKKNKSKKSNKKSNKNKNKTGNVKVENNKNTMETKPQNPSTIVGVNSFDNGGSSCSTVKTCDNAANRSDIKKATTNVNIGTSNITNSNNVTNGKDNNCVSNGSGNDKDKSNKDSSNNNNNGKRVNATHNGNPSDLKNDMDTINDVLPKTALDNGIMSKGNTHNTKSNANNVKNHTGGNNNNNNNDNNNNNLENNTARVEAESNGNNNSNNNSNEKRDSNMNLNNDNKNINNNIKNNNVKNNNAKNNAGKNNNHNNSGNNATTTTNNNNNATTTTTTTNNNNNNNTTGNEEELEMYMNEKKMLLNENYVLFDGSGNSSTSKINAEEKNRKELLNMNTTASTLKNDVYNILADESTDTNECINIMEYLGGSTIKNGEGISKNKSNEQDQLIENENIKFIENSTPEMRNFSKMKNGQKYNMTNHVVNNINNLQNFINHSNMSKPIGGNDINNFFLHKKHLADMTTNISNGNHILQNKTINKAYINNLINNAYISEMKNSIPLNNNNLAYLKDVKNNLLDKNYMNVVVNNSRNKAGGNNGTVLKSNLNMHINSPTNGSMSMNTTMGIGRTSPSYGNLMEYTLNLDSTIGNSGMGTKSVGNISLDKASMNCNLTKSMQLQNSMNKVLSNDMQNSRTILNIGKDNYENPLQKKKSEHVTIERPVILNNSQMLEAFMEGRLCLSCDSLDHPMPLCPNNSFVCPNCHNVSHRGNDCPMKCRFCLKFHTGTSIMDCLKKARIQSERNVLKQDKNDPAKLNKATRNTDEKTSVGPRFDLSTRPDNSYGRSVYVSNLSDDISNAQLRNTINSHLDNGCVVNIDRQEGYAFVELSNLSSTFQLVQKSITINYKKLKIQFKKTGQFLVPDHMSMATNGIEENHLGQPLNVQPKVGKSGFGTMLSKNIATNTAAEFPNTRINSKGSKPNIIGNMNTNANSNTVAAVSSKLSENGNLLSPNLNEGGPAIINGYVNGENKGKPHYNKMMFHKGAKMSHILQSQMQLQLLQMSNANPNLNPSLNPTLNLNTNPNINTAQQNLMLNASVPPISSLSQIPQISQSILPPRAQALMHPSHRRQPPHINAKMRKKKSENFNYALGFPNILPMVDSFKDINKNFLQRKDNNFIGDRNDLETNGDYNVELLIRQQRKNRAGMTPNSLMNISSAKGMAGGLPNLNEYLLQNVTDENVANRYDFSYIEDVLLNENIKTPKERKYQSLYFNGLCNTFSRDVKREDGHPVNGIGATPDVGTEKDADAKNKLLQGKNKLSENNLTDLKEEEHRENMSLDAERNTLLGSNDTSESIFNAQLFNSLTVKNYLNHIQDLGKKEYIEDATMEEKKGAKVEEKGTPAGKKTVGGEQVQTEEQEQKTDRTNNSCTLENVNNKNNKLSGTYSSVSTNVDNLQANMNPHMLKIFLNDKEKTLDMYANLDIQTIIDNVMEMNDHALNFSETSVGATAATVVDSSCSGADTGNANVNEFCGSAGNLGNSNSTITNNASVSGNNSNVDNNNCGTNSNIPGSFSTGTGTGTGSGVAASGEEKIKVTLTPPSKQSPVFSYYNLETHKTMKEQKKKNKSYFKENFNKEHFKDRNIHLNDDNSYNICNDMFFGNNDLHDIFSKLDVSKIIDSNSDHNNDNNNTTTTTNYNSGNTSVNTNLSVADMLNERNETCNIINDNTSNTFSNALNKTSFFNNTIVSFNSATENNTPFTLDMGTTLNNNQKVHSRNSEKREDIHTTNNPNIGSTILQMPFKEDIKHNTKTSDLNTMHMKGDEEGDASKKEAGKNENAEYINESYMQNAKCQELDAIEEDLERHIKALWNLRNYRRVNQFGIPNN